MKPVLVLLCNLFTLSVLAQPIASISGNAVSINNGAIEAEISGGRMISLNVIGQSNLLNNGGSGYMSYNDNDGFYSPTTLPPFVRSNTDEIADVYFRITDNFKVEMHYVFRKGESGFYTYFVVKDAGLPDKTIGQFRFALRVDKDIFDYAWTIEREGDMIHPDVLANYVEEVQDATYLLQDGSIYTKYDWCVDKAYDYQHGLMGNGVGVWNIEASHEYINGGPTMQETTLHGTSTTPILLCPFYTTHFGGEQVVLRDEYESWSKIFGPTFTYLNSGTNEEIIEDAKLKAAEKRAQWPYQWLVNDLYPLDRGSLSGRLEMQGGGEVDSAMVLLCKSGPSWLLEDDHWQKQPYDYMFWAEADASGHFNIEKIRPGTYTLYAYTQKGKLIDELRKDGMVINVGSNDAGTLLWDANDKEKTIFQIGTADHKSSEYRLADLPRLYGRWKSCPLSLTYDTQTDTPRDNWYYCQRENSYWNIKFTVEDVSSLVDPSIKVGLAGADARPHLDFVLNGTTVSVNDLGTDSGIRRSSLSGGKYVLLACDVDKSLLKDGVNILTMRCYGSDQEYKGVMYDAILLEADTDGSSSVNALKSNAGISVYPNPASGSIVVKSDQKMDEIRILDVSGKTVFMDKSDMDYAASINITGLSTGLYVVQVYAKNSIGYQRLLVD